VEGWQDGGDGARREAPALEGTLGQPAVDQNQGNAALRAGQNKIGPEIGLDENRKIGEPMIEKAIHESRRIERDELMNGARGQTMLREVCRCNSAGSAEHAELFAAYSFHQRNDGEHL